MTATDTLLPLNEVTSRLRILGQRYVGVRPIEVENIIGTVDRAVDFDRLFRPRRRPLKDRVRALRRVFPDGVIPPIAAYEAGGMYFVVDGHHRVALAHELGMEFIDAEVTAMSTSHRLTPGVDVLQLVHTQQHRTFKERTGLLVRHPEAKIEFGRPTSYGDLLDIVQAYAYEMSQRTGELVAMADATADWYETEFQPALEAVRNAELPDSYRHKTEGDLFLWVHGKRRQLRTTNRDATWAEAAIAARREGVTREQQRELERERRRPLPSQPIQA